MLPGVKHETFGEVDCFIPEHRVLPGTEGGRPRLPVMRHDFSNDVVKIRMMAAQMRQHAKMVRQADYIAKFEQAADELEHKADEAERRGAPCRMS